MLTRLDATIAETLTIIRPTLPPDHQKVTATLS